MRRIPNPHGYRLGWLALGALTEGCFGGRAPEAPHALRIEDVRDAAQVATTSDHACVVRRNGQLDCWGDRTCFAADHHLPAVRAVSLAMDHGCAVTQAGLVVCWGKAVPGRMNGESPEACVMPRELPDIRDAVDVSTSGDHTCVVRRTGHVACFGGSDFGKVGASAQAKGPVELPGIRDATAVVTTPLGACVVTGAGALGCWGAGAVVAWAPKALPGRADPDKDPVTQPRFLRGITDVVAFQNGCILHRTGRVECWSTEEKSLLDDEAVAARVQVRGVGDGVE